MVAPIYRYREERAQLGTSLADLYGVTTAFMRTGTTKSEITATVNAMQLANRHSSAVTIDVATTDGSTVRSLAKGLSIPAGAALDPLSGQLNLEEDMVIQALASVADVVDVHISLVEVALATAS